MQASVQDFYGDTYGYPSIESKSRDAVDLHGYVNGGVPIDRRVSAIYSPIAGGEVRDSKIASAIFHARTTGNHSHRYTPYRQPVPTFIPSLDATHPIASVQLVPDDSAVLNQDPEMVSRLPTVSVNGLLLSPVNTRSTEPIFSPIANDDQPSDRLINLAYGRVEGTTFPEIPGPTAPSNTPLPTGAHIVAYPSSSVIMASSERDVYGTSETTENRSLVPSLPIVKLTFGAWKCVVCGCVLRRKHRAVVHFWNKHGGMRLNCIGRCGWIDWNAIRLFLTSISDKSFASQDGLDVHLNPVLVDCPSCGKTLLKKNIIRHRDRHCPFAGNGLVDGQQIE